METVLNSLLSEAKTSPRSNFVYDYSEPSESSDFYGNLFDSKTKSRKNELYGERIAKSPEVKRGLDITETIVSTLEKKLDKNAVVIEVGGGLFQGRSANAYKRFTNYFPLDISRTSIERYATEYSRFAIIADATKLPFKDGTVDCIFTITFLEHPLEPEKVLSEISRVLKKGGIVVHNDAWFCRWWQHYGVYNLKRFNEMTAKEKLIFFAVKASEFPPIRIPPIIIKRVFRGLFESTKGPIKLHYRKLKPNYSLYLGCDEDAASSIDPVDVIRFYESRGFKLCNELSMMQRLFHPNKWIMLQKM